MQKRNVRLTFAFVGMFLLSQVLLAATKPHVISFGKWTAVKVLNADGAESASAVKIHALVVDGHVKEYATGAAHDVTDRLFVIRRAFRVNDGLPAEMSPRWQWQLGGWLLVDRVTGRVSAVSLPNFDSEYSEASWYRDYVAYCGLSDDGKKSYAIVAQLARRKPVLKKALAGDEPESGEGCAAPVWQRSPSRVSFEAAGGERQTYAIRGSVVDVVVNDDEEEGTK